MAIILKEGNTYTDKFGNVYSDAYGVIDATQTDKNSLYHKFSLRIFKDSAARIAKMQPLEVINFSTTLDKDRWEEYKAINQYTQSYTWLLSKTIKNTEVVDGEEVITEELEYGDWESDE